MHSLILLIQTLANTQEVDIIFTLAPSKFQVEDKYWNMILNTNLEYKNMLDREMPQRRMLEFAIENDIKIIDLYPTLQTGSSSADLLNHKYEQHWTQERKARFLIKS